MESIMELSDHPTESVSYLKHRRRAILIGRVERMLKRFYSDESDPYRQFEHEIMTHVNSRSTLLDAGCGQSAPVLSYLAPRVGEAIGVDLVQFDPALRASGIRLLNHDLSHIPLPPGSVDVAISRSVLEHLPDPAAVYAEVYRILKPGGKFIFITPNVWAYPSIAARIIPNRFHARIVEWAEGRPEGETFDTYYRSNSRRSIKKLAAAAGFQVTSLRHLNSFPNYLMFHPIAFLMGVAVERLISRFLKPMQQWILGVLTKPRRADPESVRSNRSN